MRDLRAIALAAWLAAMLSACGGDSSQVADGGVGGSGISRGSVTELASITVNGRRLETDAATVRVNGRVAGFNEIKLGHVVRVEADFDRGVAETIHYRPTLQGKVDAVSLDSGTGTLTVVGHPVVVTNDTRVGGMTDLSTVSPGDRLSISGLRTSDGAIRATRIEEPLDSKTRIFGRMHSPGVAGQDTLRMGGITVDHSSATTTKFPGGSPTAGDNLVVVGTENAGVLDADTIDPAVLLGAAPGESLELTGVLNGVAGSDALELLGRRLDVSEASVDGGSLADLVDGKRVRVQGQLGNDGRIVASTVTLLAP